MHATPRDTSTVALPTSLGPARVHLRGRADRPLLALGHGAGGGPGILEGLDLTAARDAALAVGWQVALVEQPWHVAGRRVATAPATLDRAWLEILQTLAAGRPHVAGGRSAGARVACRTALSSGAAGVLALAFPLTPPRTPERTRAAELGGAGVPVLVIQGARDAFGVPPAQPGVQVHPVAGADHAFHVRRRDGRAPAEVGAEIAAAVGGFLVADVLLA